MVYAALYLIFIFICVYCYFNVVEVPLGHVIIFYHRFSYLFRKKIIQRKNSRYLTIPFFYKPLISSITGSYVYLPTQSKEKIDFETQFMTQDSIKCIIKISCDFSFVVDEFIKHLTIEEIVKKGYRDFVTDIISEEFQFVLSKIPIKDEFSTSENLLKNHTQKMPLMIDTSMLNKIKKNKGIIL